MTLFDYFWNEQLACLCLLVPMIPDATDWSNLQFQLFHVCILHMFMAIKGQLNLFYSCGGLLLQVFISHEWATWLSFFAWWRAKGSVHEYRLDFNVGRRFFVLPVRPWSKAYQSEHWLAYSVWWNRFSTNIRHFSFVGLCNTGWWHFHSNH